MRIFKFFFTKAFQVYGITWMQITKMWTKKLRANKSDESPGATNRAVNFDVKDTNADSLSICAQQTFHLLLHIWGLYVLQESKEEGGSRTKGESSWDEMLDEERSHDIDKAS